MPEPKNARAHTIRHTGTYVLPMGHGLSRASVEKFSLEVASRFGFRFGDRLTKILESLKVRTTMFEPIGNVSTATLLLAEPDGGVRFGSNANLSMAGARIDHAQALGHLLLHYPAAKEAHPDTPMRVPYWPQGEDDENWKIAVREGHWFSWSFLMPELAFRDTWDRTGGNVARLSHDFDVPGRHVTMRARMLQLTEPEATRETQPTP